jgi:hypothetical protein
MRRARGLLSGKGSKSKNAWNKKSESKKSEQKSILSCVVCEKKRDHSKTDRWRITKEIDLSTQETDDIAADRRSRSLHGVCP